jgi:hypothetical protein
MGRLLPGLLLWLCGASMAAPPGGDFTQAECIACHGADSPEVHSYGTSKHGVLLRIGRAGRAPDCVACHGGNHAPLDQDRLRHTCHQCHSPRYVASLAANGEVMIAVGRLKLREADDLLEQARADFAAEELQDMLAIRERLGAYQARLRLGVGHQSPDYQWWHGHPALDGELLRLKGAYDVLMRKRALESTQ